MSPNYEYKFVTVNNSVTVFDDSPMESYRDKIVENATDGWRFV